MLYINLRQKVSPFAISFPLPCLCFDSSSEFCIFLAIKSSFHFKDLCQDFVLCFCFFFPEISATPVFKVIKKFFDLHVDF